MDRNKALIPFGHTRLVDHMSDILKSIRPPLDDIFVSGKIKNIKYIPDIFEEMGPLGGIYSVLQNIETNNLTSLLVVPVDMPLLSAKLLGRLQSSNKTSRFERFNLPVFFHNTAKLSKLLDYSFFNSLTKSNRSFGYILEQLHATSLPLNQGEKKQLFNLNTPDELKRLERLIV